MQRLLILLLLLLSFLVFSEDSYDYDEVEIQLVTVSPGQYYWEAFGHSAIRVKTPAYDHIYGFGYFNFEDEDFFLNFAKGEMQYYMGVEYADLELYRYKAQGREVKLQSLNLSKAQKIKIVDELASLNHEDNRYYSYDYFENNCTSRIRDILDENSNNQLKKRLSKIEESMSLFDATFPVSNQAWVNLAFAITYGLPAYQAKNKWQLSVFPEQFSNDITTDVQQNELIQSTQIWYQPNDFEIEISRKKLFDTHYALIVMLIILLIGLSFKFSRNFILKSWLFLQSLIGIGLLVLWFFTNHQVMTLNINIMLFFPLAFLLIFNKLHKPFVVNGFLIVNLAWLISALLLTNFYLIGFAFINILIWTRLRQRL
jgi:hypothetical protein